MTRGIEIVLIAFTLFAGAVEPARGEATAREYEVKAAMILNIAQFVEWPHDAFDSESSPLVIEVVGTNPFGHSLEQLAANKQVNGRSAVVKYADSPDKITPCHLLFVGPDEESELSLILDKVKGHAVLTVGETDSFPWAGGIIRFFTVDGKVRFEINLAAADEAHLKISSKLLKLARIFEKQ